MASGNGFPLRRMSAHEGHGEDDEAEDDERDHRGPYDLVQEARRDRRARIGACRIVARTHAASGCRRGAPQTERQTRSSGKARSPKVWTKAWSLPSVSRDRRRARSLAYPEYFQSKGGSFARTCALQGSRCRFSCACRRLKLRPAASAAPLFSHESRPRDQSCRRQPRRCPAPLRQDRSPAHCQAAAIHGILSEGGGYASNRFLIRPGKFLRYDLPGRSSRRACDETPAHLSPGMSRLKPFAVSSAT